MADVPRRVRTQAERDADGTTWRATADTRPGYATYPTTPPGNPSWWRGQPPTPTTADAAGPQPSDHDRCTKWCGFCHLGTGEPVEDRTAEQPALLVTFSHPVTLDEVAELRDRFTANGRPVHITASLNVTRRRWWHRYTRRNV